MHMKHYTLPPGCISRKLNWNQRQDLIPFTPMWDTGGPSAHHICLRSYFLMGVVTFEWESYFGNKINQIPNIFKDYKFYLKA